MLKIVIFSLIGLTVAAGLFVPVIAQISYWRIKVAKKHK